ncbi:MAG: hypothetical protein A2096_06030 [Spirochaetes bacterium GWF1_41_5]|nr:MAG: hypothetical protein A2096_06030 [Spirochaetes bacterium GWF1_41_5]HBE03060.1 hypothetical protein [Spirochaetia bacterium]
MKLKITLLVLLLVAVFGCATKKEKKVKLVIYMAWSNASDPNKVIIRNMANRFEKKNPGYVVQIGEMNRQNWGKILSMIASGEQIDLFELPPNHLYNFYKKGVVQDLDRFFEKDPALLSSIHHRVREVMKLNGKIVTFAKGCQTMGIYYNKDLFEKFGLPAPDDSINWTQCMELANKFTLHANKEGNTSYGLSTLLLRHYLISEGYSMPNVSYFPVSSDWKKMLLTDPDVLKKTAWLYDWSYFTHKTVPTPYELQDTSTTELFQTGRIALFFASAYTRSVLRNEVGARFKWDVIGVPKGSDGVRRSDFYSHCWVMSSKTKYPEAAWKFMKMIAGPDGAKQFVSRGIDLPIFTTKESIGAFFNSAPLPPNQKVLLDSLDSISITPLYRVEVQGIKELNNEINYKILEQKTVEPILKQYQEKYQKLLDNFREEYELN